METSKNNNNKKVRGKAKKNTKFKVRFRNRFAKVFIQLGGHVSNTCKHMGVTRTTYYGWLKRYPKFKLKIDNVILKMDDDVDMSIYQAATEDRNVKAMALWKKTKGSELNQIKRAIKQYVDEQGLEVLSPHSIKLDKVLALKSTIARLQFLFYVCLSLGKVRESLDIQKQLAELQGVYDIDTDKDTEIMTGQKMIGIFDELELTKDKKVNLPTDKLEALIQDSEYGDLYKNMFPQDNPIIDIDYEEQKKES